MDTRYPVNSFVLVLIICNWLIPDVFMLRQAVLPNNSNNSKGYLT